MGDVTRAQFMERAAQRFALQDKNGDGVLSVAEKEANLAKLAGVMQQAGKPVPERMSQLKPSRRPPGPSSWRGRRRSSLAWTRTVTG
jgi:hypothetical protein